MSCSASFTASAGFQVGSAAMQTTVRSAEPKTLKIFIRAITSAIPSESKPFRCALLLHSDYHFPPSVTFFHVSDCGRDIAQFVAAVDDWFHFSGLHELSQIGQVLLLRIGEHHAHLLADEPFCCHNFERTSHGPEQPLPVFCS